MFLIDTFQLKPNIPTIPSRLLDNDLISCTKAADSSLNWERIPFILEAQTMG